VPVERPRQIAVELLARDPSGEFLEDRLDAKLDQSGLPGPDRALCRELVFGVARWSARLDWILARYARQPQQKRTLQTILRVAFFQIFHLDRVPPHAAVDQAVQQARELGFGPQSGFVNAILRQALRDRETLAAELRELEIEDPATAYSHPPWLVERWQSKFGTERTRAILAANNTPARVFARINTLKTTPEKLVERWREEGVDYDFRTYDWTGENLVFCLKKSPPLARLNSFKDGWFYIQDPSTLLSVILLDPRPGKAVLDLCAAPGGKSTFIAQRMENRGQIAAQDRAFDRLPLLRENCARLGATIVHATKSDCVVFPELNTAFDRILVDAPCSNTGVMRRRLEVRLRIRPSEIERLVNLQAEILDQAAPLLKPGGTLVYSTCSIESEENQENVSAFLARHPDYALESERELLPGQCDTDGAYAAKLTRKLRS